MHEKLVVMCVCVVLHSLWEFHPFWITASLVGEGQNNSAECRIDLLLKNLVFELLLIVNLERTAAGLPTHNVMEAVILHLAEDVMQFRRETVLRRRRRRTRFGLRFSFCLLSIHLAFAALPAFYVLPVLAAAEVSLLPLLPSK